MNLEKLFSSLTKIKFSGGVFGKNGLLLIFFVVAAAAVAIKADTDSARLAIFLCAGAVVAYGIKRAFDFAENHPHAAILDGSEIIKHAQIVYGRKGAENLGSAPRAVDHEPAVLSQFDPDAADPPALEAPKKIDQIAVPDVAEKVVRGRSATRNQGGKE